LPRHASHLLQHDEDFSRYRDLFTCRFLESFGVGLLLGTIPSRIASEAGILQRKTGEFLGATLIALMSPLAIRRWIVALWTPQ
jgi:hypothetical protein